MTSQPLSSISDLNNDWLSQVLSQSTSTPTTVSSYTLENNLDTSNGYLSNIYSILVTTSDGTLQLVLKLLPEDEDVREMMKELSVAGRENEFYKFILKEEFKKIIPANQSLPVPKAYYSAYYEDAFTLVMENLISKGYKMVASADGVDKSLTNAAFKSLARVHALGYKYMEINGQDSLRVFHKNENNLDEIMEEEIIRGVNRYCELLDDELLCNKLKNFLETEGYKCLKADNQNSKDVLPNTLIHGDYWSGQTMCREDNDVLIIDWQFVNFSNPTDDLASYLLLSCGNDVLSNLEDVVNSYVLALNENLTLLKSDRSFSSEEVNKSIKISFGRGLWILLCSIDPFLQKNKISKERLLQVFQFADSMNLFP